MGKTYIDTVKYLVKGTIEIDGIVEKPDIVGAVFGQTEGLLGEELDLRELQKAGRIGRIEVDTKTKMGKTAGSVTLPSSMDKAETAMLAAALETIDRVGPCTAKIAVSEIQDTRSSKRDFVMARAKELLKAAGGETLETKELSQQLKTSIKHENVVEYGEDKLSAGPDIDSSKEIIVVEGRADVLNLLTYGINNVISIQGSIIPKTVVELSKTKSVTLFVDGDRGGDIVVNHMNETGKIEFVAKAPEGKEVEELTQKEILKCLKNRLPLSEFLKKKTSFGERPHREFHERRDSRGPRRDSRDSRLDSRGPRRDSRGPRRDSRDSRFGSRDSRGPRRDSRGPRRDSYRDRKPVPKKEEAPEELKKVYESVKGSMKAALVGKDNKVLEEVPVSELINKIQAKKGVEAVVFDGIITQRLVELADSKKLKTLVGMKEAKLDEKKKVKTITMS